MEGVEQEVSETQIYGSGTWKILMAESGLNMFLIRILCLVLNLLTLFIAVPWTTTMYYNAWARMSKLMGKN